MHAVQKIRAVHQTHSNAVPPVIVSVGISFVIENWTAMMDRMKNVQTTQNVHNKHLNAKTVALVYHEQPSAMEKNNVRKVKTKQTVTSSDRKGKISI